VNAAGVQWCVGRVRLNEGRVGCGWSECLAGCDWFRVWVGCTVGLEMGGECGVYPIS